MTKARGSSRSHADRLRARLADGPPLLLDGATGTALEDEGFDTSGPLWSAEVLRSASDSVARLHEAYARAGAEVHTAVTFRTHPGLFEGRGGQADWAAMLQAGVDAVQEGLKRAGVARESVWVAGSLAPVGRSYAPEKAPSHEVLEREHGLQAEGLLRAGVDLVLVETMVLVREAVIATKAGQARGLPVCVAFVVGPGARLLSGEPLQEAIAQVRRVGAQAVLVNCASIEYVEQALPVLAESGGPWGVYANGSSGDPETGWGARRSPRQYGEAASRWLSEGARIVGSCCATGPDHTRELRHILDQVGR